MKLKDINIGDKVIYIPIHLLIGDKSEMVKFNNIGIVTSKNDQYVFVRYNGTNGSQATRPDDLYSLKYRPDLAEQLKDQLE
jgi:hypothetical protein